MKSELIHRRIFPAVMGSILICLFGCAPKHSHSSRNPGHGGHTTAVTNRGPGAGRSGPGSTSGLAKAGNAALFISPAAAAANLKNLGDVPNDVPPATAINTQGGRLLIGYLKGTFSGESVVDAVFDSEKLVPYRLAEISAAILKLRSAGQFTVEDGDKVQLLETALNKRLIETVEYHDNLDRWIKYGTALAVSIPATIYAPEIVGAGKGIVESDFIQTPKSWVVRAYRGVYRGVTSLFTRGKAGAAAARAAEEAAPTVEQEVSAQAAAQAASETGSTVEQTGLVKDELAGTVGGEGATEEPIHAARAETAAAHAESAAAHAESAASEARVEAAEARAAAAEKPGIYTRLMGSYKTRFGRLTPEEVVTRNINRALSSPELARGFEVTPVPEEQMENVKAFKYSRTGIGGFGMNQAEGSRFLTVRLATPTGYKFYYVNGRAIEILTEGGQKQIVKGPTIIRIAADRMKNWSQDTAGFFGRVGSKSKQLAIQAKDAAFNNRVSQWLVSQSGKQAIQQSVVGGAAGMLTLWAINPINTRYLTVNDYLQALSKQGINLNDFPDELRTELQQEAKVPNQLAPLPAD